MNIYKKIYKILKHYKKVNMNIYKFDNYQSKLIMLYENIKFKKDVKYI